VATLERRPAEKHAHGDKQRHLQRQDGEQAEDGAWLVRSHDSRHQEDRERKRQLQCGGERQRLDHADPPAEAAHDRDLYRAGEAADDRECDCG